MKLISAFCTALIFILITSGCSNYSSVSDSNKKENTGNISFKMDKASAPQGVIRILAYLSRTDSDTLTSDLNLKTGSNADISFQKVPVGMWHLSVKAVDEDSIVIYTGETNVQVNAGIITNASLSLVPTNLGTGGVNILVNWGRNYKHWVDYKNNPILSVKDVPNFTLAVSQAQIMFDDGTYKMWFMNLYNNGRGDIGYAESLDGLSWHVNADGPVLKAGESGSWDDNSVGMGYVFKDKDYYRFYYAGTREPHTGKRQIGLAVSKNGIDWQKYPEPVLKADEAQHYIGAHAVIKIGTTYYMYYEASPGKGYKFKIYLATSTDGVHWSRYGNDPVLAPEQPWEGNNIRYPTITRHNNSYRMTYGNNKQNAFGVAYSDDGIHWTKDSNNPVFRLEDVSGNWCRQISYPFSVKVENDYRIYYSALDANNVFHLSVAIEK